MKLISFDLQSNFGFFRKPETNNTLNVSYNMIHKPAVLGILGAIIGLDGYRRKGEFPEYYQKLKNVKLGIAPLAHERGNFMKTPVKYSNTVGYANKGTNFLTEELTLIAPAYRIYLLLDPGSELQMKLIENIRDGRSEFIPYFGKNEFSAWWSNYTDYEFSLANCSSSGSVRINSLFVKDQIVKDQEKTSVSGMFGQLDVIDDEPLFMYFERLPVGFDDVLVQYRLKEMVFTNTPVRNVENMPNLYYLKKPGQYVQLL